VEFRAASRLDEWGHRAPSAVLAMAIGLPIVLSRFALQPLVGPQSPFILAWPAAMLAAFVGGFWPALFISIVGLFIGQWALRAGGAHPLGPGGVVIFLSFGLVFAVAGGLRQRGLRRARADAHRLDEMQLRLARVARLNAMGEIAATLAHEVNQPLTAIAGYAGAAERLIGQDTKNPARMTELLQKISAQTTRAREIIGRIRGQVTQGPPALAPQSLSGMFGDSLPVALAGTKVSVAVRRDFDPSADRVFADPIQVQQVIVNLIRNAVEAMADAPRRELRIGSRPADPGLVEAFVSDTGPGLDPRLIDRLFDPFVTGKADGMGIGLSVSRSIVEAHGGRIWAARQPEGGAVFRFTLRRAPAEDAA